MLQTVMFIFNQFLHVTFSHTLQFGLYRTYLDFVACFWFICFISNYLYIVSDASRPTYTINKVQLRIQVFLFFTNFITVYITICKYYLSTLHILMSVWIFSIHFLRYWQGEFVQHSKLLQLVIISFILMTLICDSGVIL